MYSLEERTKAAQLYIESDCSESIVIRTLGYPSYNTLRNWYREYTRTGELHAASAPKPRYTEQQIADAIAYFAANKTSLTQACRVLGYPTRNVLRQWIMEIKPELLKKYPAPCEKKKSLIIYDQAHKQAVVEAVLIEKIPEYKAAAQYGVSRATIYNWKRKLLGKDGLAAMAKKTEAVVNNPESLQPGKSKAELESEIADLQAQIRHLKMEQDALEKATEILKKAGGIDLTNLKNSDKAEVIDALRPTYRLKELLLLFGISKSSYFYSIHAMSHDKYAEIRSTKLYVAFESAQSCYGYRRIHAILKRSGTTVSEKVIRRLMKEEDLSVYRAKRKKYSSYAGEISPEVANIVNRDFHAGIPNSKWFTDITEFSIPAGKVYLSPIIDCFDGLAVSWSIGTSPFLHLPWSTQCWMKRF